MKYPQLMTCQISKMQGTILMMSLKILKLAEMEIAIESQNLCGILWLTQTTSFDSFPLESFTDEQMKTNVMKVSVMISLDLSSLLQNTMRFFQKQ